jgi:putative peptide zinc metalloprotease protein
MALANGAHELEGRKKVRVRLRPNLSFVAQQEAGETCYILHDPVSLKNFRVTPKQRFVVEQMDGTQTLNAIRKSYEQRFRPDRLSLEELESFAAQLLEGGLAQNESPHAGRLLFARAEKQRHRVRRDRLLNFLYIRVPLFNPERLLSGLLTWLGFLFTPAFAVAGVVLLLTALGLLASHWADFIARLPAARELLSLQSIVYVWIALGLVKIVHELGHGLTCKALGGKVPEMGVLLLFFFPCLYCDVSDCWRIPSKWKRIAISAAGIYVELLIAAMATFGWWLSDPGSVLHNLFLALMVVCSVNTVLVNANPLMRFDGYYILSDWLGVPNLAEQSSRVVRTACLRWLGVQTPSDATAPRRRVVLAGYALVSYVYRWVAAGSCFYLLYTTLQPYKLGALGYVVAIAGIAIMCALPLQRLLATIHRQGRLPEMKPARVMLAGGVLVVLALGVWLVPLPQNVCGTALVQIEPDELQRLVVPQAGGFLKELPVHDGQRVREGQVIAVLDNPPLALKQRVNEADQALRLQQKSAYLAELTDAGAPDPLTAAGLQQVEAELQALLREQAILREQLERLTLRAPLDGVVTGLGTPEAKGKWLEPGSDFCHVANDGALRATLLIGPADHELIAPASRAWLHVHGSGLRSTAGLVHEIAQVEAKSIPAPLSSRAGGDIATRQDAASGNDQPYQPHYLVAVRLPRADRSTHPGALGRVRIEAAPQTLGWHFARWLGTTFNWGL